MLTDMDIVFRFVISALIGIVIGFARRGKAAGARTFALICLGATIFTIVSINPIFSGIDSYDPTRIIAQIVAGIGFLGLGVIWKQGGNQPAGLTTAAAIWVTAAVGVLIGLGLWLESGLGALLTLLILFSKKPLHDVNLD